MRKVISLGLLALMFTLFSSQVFAEKTEACELIKKDPDYKTFYGLCNAYWNADDAVAQAQIFANLQKKVGSEEAAKAILGIESTTVCPCWDYDELVQAIACAGLPLSIPVVDEDPDDETGFDMAWFQNSSLMITAIAGYHPLTPGLNHGCFVNVITGEDKVPFAETSMLEDLQCRLDVLDLLTEPPLHEDCEGL